MKVIDLLVKIANDEIKPVIYFRVNLLGHNLIIKYVYFSFIVEKVYSSFSKSAFKEGESIDNIILTSLNRQIEIIDNIE